MTQDVQLRSSADIPLRQVDTVQKLLFNNMAKQQLATVAAKHMDPSRMMRVVANAIRTTPKLQECDPMSFLGAMMTCSSLGIEPNTTMGHAYLVPFENKRRNIFEVQLIVGYKGFIDLAYRSGKISSIHAGIHYSDDELWEYENGTEARLRHCEGPQEGKKLHAYAIARFKDGGHAYVVLPWHHVMKIRNGSQGYKSAIKFGKKDTPWITHEDQMASKTAIRALAKYLPMSAEFRDFSDAIGLDERRGVDYREFALDPSIGIPLGIENEFIESEGLDEDETPEREVKKATPAPVRKEPEPKRKEAEHKAAAPEPERKPVEQSDDRPRASADKPDLAKKMRDVAAHIEVDLLDGMTPAEVRITYAEALEEMSELDQELRAKVEAEIASYEQPADLFGAENPFAETFLDDVKTMGLDEAQQFHATAIAQMEMSNPDLFEQMMEQAKFIA